MKNIRNNSELRDHDAADGEWVEDLLKKDLLPITMNENQEALEDQPKPSPDEEPKETDEFQKSYEFAGKLLRQIGLRVHYEDRIVGLKWIIKHIFFVLSFWQLAINDYGELSYFLKSIESNVIEATAIAPCLGYSLMGLSKMICVANHRYLIQDLVNELRALWPSGKVSEEDRLIMNKSLRRVYLTTRCETLFYFMLMFMYNLQPWVPMVKEYINTGNYTRTLPYFIIYPFNQYRDGVYQLIFVWQYWSGFSAVMAVAGTDSLFQGSCSHICMLFQLLHRELRDIIPEADTEIEELEDVVCLKKLMKIIEKHQKLLSICEDLETTYSVDLLINVLTASIIICCVGFQSILGMSVALVKFIVFLCGTIFQTLLLSYYGNLLIEKSGEISEAAYNCRWYMAGPRFKACILTIMARAQKPSCVTTMGFAQVSLITFTAILGRSWSYFTLLRTMFDPNELKKSVAEKISNEI